MRKLQGDEQPQKTFGAIFADPVSGTIDWKDIEHLLLVAVGCQVVEGSGSRVRCFNAEVETFHRPHPAKEAKCYQVKAARDFANSDRGAGVCVPVTVHPST